MAVVGRKRSWLGGIARYWRYERGRVNPMLTARGWLAVIPAVLAVAAVIVLAVLATATPGESPENQGPVVRPGTPLLVDTGLAVIPSPSPAPVQPFRVIERTPVDPSVSFGLILFLVDSDGLLRELDPDVSYFDYLAGQAARGEVSSMRLAAGGGAASDAVASVNIRFMDFPVPPSGGYYHAWLTEMLALGRHAQATTLERPTVNELRGDFGPDTYTELAEMYQTALRIRNELARVP